VTTLRRALAHRSLPGAVQTPSSPACFGVGGPSPVWSTLTRRETGTPCPRIGFVLAASPVESARLCFLSDPGGPGLGNSSDLVGRNLMYHLQTIAVGIFRQRFSRRARGVGDPRHQRLRGVVLAALRWRRIGRLVASWRWGTTPRQFRRART